RASTAPLSAPAAGDQVDVSAAASQLNKLGGQDFDSAKVEAIRTAIREGRFTVNAGAIADQLIADATALLGPRTA
ncbi:MAG: flagellar biosynthesis anti-sigma factor FlgM, partial [Ramlibacter sp.]